MSELSEFRETFHAILTEAHGTAQRAPTADPVLPPGAHWVPHNPKPGPLPPRKYAPASEFVDLCNV